MNIRRLQRYSVWMGLSAIGIALLLVVLHWFSVIPASALAIGGQSELRTIGEVAVFGCLLAAFGYWND